jgi:hypothetical protein
MAAQHGAERKRQWLAVSNCRLVLADDPATLIRRQPQQIDTVAIRPGAAWLSPPGSS